MSSRLLCYIFLHILLLRISQALSDKAGRYEGIPLAFMTYAQRRVEWLVLANPLAKHSQTLCCSGIIRTCCRCLKYYLTAKNTASPANSPSWLGLDSVPLLINGELPTLTATTGAVCWPNRTRGGAPRARFASRSSSLMSGGQFSLYPQRPYPKCHSVQKFLWTPFRAGTGHSSFLRDVCVLSQYCKCAYILTRGVSKVQSVVSAVKRCFSCWSINVQNLLIKELF